MGAPMLIPMAVGAIGGAATSDDPFKGALMGAGMGAMGGAALGGLGAAGGAAGAAGGSGAVPSLLSQVPGAAGTQLAMTAAPAGLAGGAAGAGAGALGHPGLMGSVPITPGGGLLGGSAGDFAGLGAAQLGSPAMPGMAPVTNLAVHGGPQQMGMMDALRSSGQAMEEVMGAGGGDMAENAMMMASMMGGRGEQQQQAPMAPAPRLSAGGESFAAMSPMQAQQQEMMRRLQMGSGIPRTSGYI